MIPKPTWKECYEHQRIGRRIRQLDREFYASDITDVKTVTRIRNEIEPLEDRYDLFQTRQLQREAERHCVEIPKEPTWWRSVSLAKLTGIESWDMDVELLTEAGQRNVRKLIREERLRLIRLRVEVLIPVLSLIVAI